MKKKKFKNVIFIIFILGMVPFSNICFANENSIILNEPFTDDVNHTFKYPNLQISDSVNPYSITLSIENGCFNTNNSILNDNVSLYFDFIGGINTLNDYISALNTTENYKLITFNLNKNVDITNTNTKTQVINSISNFLSDITFKNDKNKDAKFSLTFSELELSLTNTENNLNNIKLVSFKDSTQSKEHYYAKINADGIDWQDAYNIATSLRFNNLQGYLLTVTSEEEHNFIYQSLGSFYGWMGAASIENAGDITYNQKNISWNPAYDKLPDSGEYGHDPNLDSKIEKYWYWVAGPEAGQKLFDGYTNFNKNEPNNCGGHEWTAQYGNGADGSWNDFKDTEDVIKGYYIEFGGFEDDDEIVKPVSLVNTFKWKDYDFRNIKDRVDENLNNIVFDKNITVNDVDGLVDDVIKDAIYESGVSNVTYRILNKKIENNILSFDVEVTIGEDENQKMYNINFAKKINDDEEKLNIEENPKTGDNVTSYLIIGSLSLISLGGCILYLNRRRFN